MFKFLLRCVMFIAGVVVLADVALPLRTEQLQVDQHTSDTRDTRSTSRNGRYNTTNSDTSYQLRLIGGTLSSCSVGYSAYSTLEDGDKVEVKSTKIFKNCVRVLRGDQLIESDKHWKLFSFIASAFLIAAAFGWLKDDEEGQGIHLHLG